MKFHFGISLFEQVVKPSFSAKTISSGFGISLFEQVVKRQKKAWSAYREFWSQSI